MRGAFLYYVKNFFIKYGIYNIMIIKALIKKTKYY